MTPLRIGFIPLADCAVLAVAEAKGIFRRHGLDVVLRREASWASLRDRLAVGALDGAQLLAGMPLAAAVGIDPVAAPTLTAFSLGLNGNAITVSQALWARMTAANPDATARRATSGAALRAVLDGRHRQPPLRLAMVYPFAPHNYELRYWLAAAGIDPDTEVTLSVVPPPRVVDALAAGTIDGFCVGEPWSSVAVARGLGRIAITSYDLWNNSPEKVLAVRRDFVEREPECHRALLRALLEAAAWADAPANRQELAVLLADERYVGAPPGVLAGALTGCLRLDAAGALATLPDFHVFHRYAANFPWTSHGVWLLLQMLRWGHLDAAVDVRAAARAVYRPDLYREAARDLGLAAPDDDFKVEGVHAAPWTLQTAAGPLTMGSDLFLDGSRFDPHAVMASLSGFRVASPRVSLDELAALNP